METCRGNVELFVCACLRARGCVFVLVFACSCVWVGACVCLFACLCVCLFVRWFHGWQRGNVAASGDGVRVEGRETRRKIVGKRWEGGKAADEIERLEEKEGNDRAQVMRT